MRSDEQVYPIEKSTDIENVWSLSAFQIGLLLRAADPEAMYGAARDYLSTAENLDAMADEIRRGATDLADTWRGDAAHESQHQLRRYYASARSLATACRASAAAMNNAAMALEAAQVHAKYLHPDFNPADYPSTDPTSIESRNYQKLLNDLNSAYRDACSLAPTQIAVSLPARESVDDISPNWKSRDDRMPGAGTGTVSDAGEAGGGNSTNSHPLRLPPMIPTNLPRRGLDTGNGTDDGSRDPIEVPPVWSPQVGAGRTDWSGSPYDIGGVLAGGGGAGGLESGLEGGGRRVIGEGYLPGSGAGAGGGPGGVSDDRPRVGASTGTGNQGGIYSPGLGQREEERDRKRRYYLKEEREVWGEQEASPAVFYGDYYRPPKPTHDDDDDDDDDF